MDSGPEIHNLASGSSGNSMLVRFRGTTGLIDAGLPIRRLTSALRQIGSSPAEIDFVFITHEHSDHIRALPQLRRMGVTVVTSRGTAQALAMAPSEYVPAIAWKSRAIGAFDVTPLPVSHDSAESLGVLIVTGETSLAVLTDLGCVTQELIDPLCSADILVIEANHDIDMLRYGPYPHYLKQRVLSRRGHLSNGDCGFALQTVFERNGKPRKVWLAHLSETNNRPQTALSTVSPHISGVPVAALPRHTIVDVMQVPESSFVSDLPAQRRLWIDP